MYVYIHVYVCMYNSLHLKECVDNFFFQYFDYTKVTGFCKGKNCGTLMSETAAGPLGL